MNINTQQEILEATAVTVASSNKIVILAQGPALENSVNTLLKNGWKIESCKSISGNEKVIFIFTLYEELPQNTTMQISN